MSIATDLLLDVASEKNGFKIGEPWRFSEFSLAAIVPIIRIVDIERQYQLLSEAGKTVKMRDTGDINRVEMVNSGGMPVLMKAGEMVTGSTQTRALVTSQVVMAGEKIVAECVCVHSTHGIRAGQEVKSGGYTPSDVRRNIFAGYVDAGRSSQRRGMAGSIYSYSGGLQSQVWGGVKGLSARMALSGDSLHSAARSNPLVGASLASGLPDGGAQADFLRELGRPWSTGSEDLIGRVNEAQKKFGAVLEQVPKFDNQVGICFLAMSGFESLESFEHPDSWEALRNAILKSEAGKIADVSDQNGLFEFKSERAKAVIREALSTSFDESLTVDKQDTATILLSSEKLTGEVVSLYDRPIHCSFFRKEA